MYRLIFLDSEIAKKCACGETIVCTSRSNTLELQYLTTYLKQQQLEGFQNESLNENLPTKM